MSTRYNWNMIESGVKHLQINKQTNMIKCQHDITEIWLKVALNTIK